MRDKLIMSAKERKRKVILEDVKRGYISLTDAAPRMGVGYRQAKRIWQRYSKFGDKGLIHKSRGKPSSHTYPVSFKEKDFEDLSEEVLGFWPDFCCGEAGRRRQADYQ